MKTSFKHTLQLLTMLAILFSACNQRQFGHLSKVRVKQKDVAISKKESKEKSEMKEEAIEEEQVVTSAEPETAIVLGSNRNIIGKKQSIQINKQTKPIKKSELKKLKKEKQDNPYPNKPNIAAYIGLGLAVLSVLFTILELSLIQDGWAIIIAFFLSIPALILGIIGYSQYRREKATDGYMASLFTIIIGSIFLLILLLLLILVLVLVASGVYF